MTRILDLSTDIAGRHATRLLADYGYEVVYLELPDTSPALPEIRREGVASASPEVIEHQLNRNKTVVTFDFTDPARRPELEKLLASADIVTHTLAPDLARKHGLDRAALEALKPNLVLTTVTAYGYEGAPARRATEKTLFAEGGAMIVGGEWPSRMGEGSPFCPNALAVSTIGGVYAAMGMLTHGVMSGGEGGFRHIDIALRDLIAANLERVLTYYTYLHVIALRGARRERLDHMAGSGDYQASDGYFHVWSTRTATFENLAFLIGRPELAEDPTWTRPRLRTMSAQEVDDVIQAGVRNFTLAELTARARELKMPCGEVVEIARLASVPQMKHRGAVVVGDDGTVDIEEAYRFANNRRRRGGGRVASLDDLPPPAADHRPSRDPTLPLKGVRILDLTHAYAGPSATRILAELGAEVIKVEATNRPDLFSRGIIPFENNTEGNWWERSGFFAERNICKKGITLDMARPEGRELFAALLPHVDVVTSNFTPGVMERWGYGAKDLLEKKPGLIVLEMSGFGGEGPDADRRALAGLIEASSGFTATLRRQDGERPLDMGFSFGDMVSGIHAALSVLIALDRRDRTGEGDAIDFSCAEAPTPMVAWHLAQWARTGRVPSVTEEIVAGGRHRLIRTTGGDGAPERWVLTFIEEGREAEAAALLNDTDPASDFVTVGEAQDEMVTRLRQGGFAAAPLSDGEQLLLDPELHRRQVFDLVSRPDVGVLPHARAFPMLCNGRPMGRNLVRPPKLGEHTRETLQGLLGMEAEALDRLEQSGIIGTLPVEPLPRALSTPLPLDQIEALGRIRSVPDAAGKLAEAFKLPAREAAE